MYVIRNLKYISKLTGREYPFQRDMDGASKADALRRLEADNRVAIQAAERRAGAPLSTRQLLGLDKAPSPAPSMENVTHLRQPEADPAVNPWNRQLDEWTNRVARTPAEKRLKKAMIEKAQQQAAKWEANRALELEREALFNDPKVTEAIAVAKERVATLIMDETGNVTDADIATAKANLAALEQNADVAKFRQDDRAGQNAILDRYRARRAEQEAAIKEVSEAIRAGEVALPPAEPEPKPAPTSDLDAIRQRLADNPPMVTA